jgi:hypothetical protein
LNLIKALKGTSKKQKLPLNITSKSKRDFFNKIKFKGEYYFRGNAFNFIQEKKMIGMTKKLKVKFLQDEQEKQRKFNFNFLVSIDGEDQHEIMNLRKFLKKLQ